MSSASDSPRPTAQTVGRGTTQPRPTTRPAAERQSGAQPARGLPGSGQGRAPAEQLPGRAAVPAEPAPAATTVTPAQRTRKARLVIARVDPWSVMKLSFLLSIALAVIMVVAVAVLWSVLDNMGVFDSATKTIADVTEGEEGGGFDLMQYVGLSRVLGVTTVLACVNIVLVTALATLGAFLYNLATSLVGGLHVTLSEDA